MFVFSGQENIACLFTPVFRVSFSCFCFHFNSEAHLCSCITLCHCISSFFFHFFFTFLCFVCIPSASVYLTFSLSFSFTFSFLPVIFLFAFTYFFYYQRHFFFLPSGGMLSSTLQSLHITFSSSLHWLTSTLVIIFFNQVLLFTFPVFFHVFFVIFTRTLHQIRTRFHSTVNLFTFNVFGSSCLRIPSKRIYGSICRIFSSLFPPSMVRQVSFIHSLHSIIIIITIQFSFPRSSNRVFTA